MKKLLLFTLVLSLVLMANVTIGQHFKSNKYSYTINLNNVIDDKIQVTLITPVFKTGDAVFHVPKIVPGTYAVYNFGRYISNFKAFDSKGKIINVTRLDTNSWKIVHAATLAKITYNVDDTWDSPEIKGAEIFQPAGTDIEKDKFFAINTFAYFGYFDGMKNLPFEISITKPVDFYGSTSLKAKHLNSSTDIYTTSNYYNLADAPMMYNKPDTTTLNVGGSEVLVSLYSPNKKSKSADLAKELKTTLEAQSKYLGGKLPVSKYAFLVSLSDNKNLKSYGALEHSYSSFYFLPETFTGPQLAKTLIDAGSHEFFHIVTPLSIHSEEIGSFDYDHPKMSAHLWLYEGLTEYAAHHMQLKYGLVTFPSYLELSSQKLTESMRYNDTLAFTRMSKGVLDTFANQYLNVYAKGSLIGLCLDIKLRQLSNGKYGTQNLMADLSKTYGKNRSFKDGELFATITKLTYPEIGVFLNKYVGGTSKLPYKEVFDVIGVEYQAVLTTKRADFGRPNLSYNPATQNLFVADTISLNAYGKKMGYKQGDEFLSINNKKLPPVTQVQEFFNNIRDNLKPGDVLTIVVARKENGKVNEVTLSQPVELVDSKKTNVLKEYKQLTPDQAALRKAWLSTDN